MSTVHRRAGPPRRGSSAASRAHRHAVRVRNLPRTGDAGEQRRCCPAPDWPTGSLGGAGRDPRARSPGWRHRSGVALPHVGWPGASSGVRGGVVPGDAGRGGVVRGGPTRGRGSADGSVATSRGGPSLTGGPRRCHRSSGGSRMRGAGSRDQAIGARPASPSQRTVRLGARGWFPGPATGGRRAPERRAESGECHCPAGRTGVTGDRRGRCVVPDVPRWRAGPGDDPMGSAVRRPRRSLGTVPRCSKSGPSGPRRASTACSSEEGALGRDAGASGDVGGAGLDGS